jgi:hypothetical protein
MNSTRWGERAQQPEDEVIIIKPPKPDKIPSQRSNQFINYTDRQMEVASTHKRPSEGTWVILPIRKSLKRSTCQTQPSLTNPCPVSTNWTWQL